MHHLLAGHQFLYLSLNMLKSAHLFLKFFYRHVSLLSLYHRLDVIALLKYLLLKEPKNIFSEKGQIHRLL